MIRCRGFTLTEIAVSMLVFAVAILTVLALLPTGYRAQSVSRQQVFAASLAVTLMESFHNPISTSLGGIGEEGYAGLFNAVGRAKITASGQDARWKDGAFSPGKGWAWITRESMPLETVTAHDFERVLCNRVNGLIPLPDLIARRLDSDGDEVRRILDDGGRLYYVDPGVVRGLKWGHKFDLGKADSNKSFRDEAEIQRIIVAVSGLPQQNASVVDPVEVWPWYELYPFPPNWCAGNGMDEMRSWVVGPPNSPPAAKITNRNGDDVNTITRYDSGLLYILHNTGVKPLLSTSANSWSEAGWLGQHWGSRVRLAMRRLDVGDATTGDERLWMSSPYTPGVNDEVWQAFRRLAIGDYDRVVTPPNLRAPGADLSTALDDVDGVGDGGFDGAAGWIPVTITTGSASKYASNPDVNGDGLDTSTDRDVTQRPGTRGGIQPTYEVRASYRDRAIALWNSVRPTGFPALDRAPISGAGIVTAGGGIAVNDVISDTEQYECPPSELAKFALVDPVSLVGTTMDGRPQYPPHPAQVQALSFLAHSAMCVTGQRPPFRQPYPAVDDAHKGAPDEPLYDTRDPFYKVRVDLATNPDREKDAKIVDSPAIAGASSVQLRNDYDGTIVLYHGDFLWFQDDPGRVHEVQCASPLVIVGLAPATVSFGRSYAVDERGYTPIGGPAALGAAIPAGGKALRVASLADLAFARVTHEMCLRWAMAYGRETNLDWGAPRPANQMLSTDRPLALQDLWHDAGPQAGDPLKFNQPEGQAQRRVSNPPMETFSAGAEGPWYARESFYRHIYPRNPMGPDPVTGNSNRPSNYGARLVKAIRRDIDDEDITRSNMAPAEQAKYQSTYRLTDWYQFDRFWSMWHNRHLREPSPGADAKRYWLDRPFSPSHRTRELVFWSCDWKQYEDAETVPSAVIDMAKINTFPSRTNGGKVDAMGRLSFATNYYAGSFLFEHPEGLLVWTDVNRTSTAETFQSGSTNPAVLDTIDISFGHYGADRNANGRLDRGQVPASARMRAISLVRMSFYDPVMPLHAGN